MVDFSKATDDRDKMEICIFSPSFFKRKWNFLLSAKVNLVQKALFPSTNGFYGYNKTSISTWATNAS